MPKNNKSINCPKVLIVFSQLGFSIVVPLVGTMLVFHRISIRYSMPTWFMAIGLLVALTLTGFIVYGMIKAVLYSTKQEGKD